MMTAGASVIFFLVLSSVSIDGDTGRTPLLPFFIRFSLRRPPPYLSPLDDCCISGDALRNRRSLTASDLRRYGSVHAIAAGFVVFLIAAAILFQTGFIPYDQEHPAAGNRTEPAPSGIKATPDAAPVATLPAAIPADSSGNGDSGNSELPADIPSPPHPATTRTALYNGPAVTITGTTTPYSFTAPPMGSGPEVPVINATSLSARIHELVNRERRAHEVPALRTDPALTSLAIAHSADMASHGYFGHLNLQDRDATARGAAAGYVCHREPDSYYTYTIAENLFATYRYDSVLFIQGTATGYGWKTEEMIAEETVDGWMKSPDHRENLLDRDLSREGVGVVIGKNDLVFITEDLC